MIFPLNQDKALTLNPGKEAFHQPASLVTTQSSAILCSCSYPVSLVRRDHFNTILPQFLVQLVTVVRTVANEILQLGFDHAEVKTQLHQGDFMMIRRISANCQRQPVRIDNF